MEKKTLKMTMTVIAIVLAGLAVISCNRDKTAQKGPANLPPEHSKMIEAYKKSVQESIATVVAKVNGADITARDLVSEMNAIAPQHIKPGQKRDPQTDQKVRKEALDRLIYRELAVQEAVRQGMRVPPEKIEDTLKKIKAGLKSEDAFRENLAKSGLTEEDLKKQIERNILVEMITEREIFNRVQIDPQLVKKTYARDKSSYRGPSGQMSFEEARPLIEEKLMTSAVQKREDEWVGQLKKAARITVTLGQSAKEIHGVN